MRCKVSNTPTMQQAKCKRCIDKNVRTLPALMIIQQVYVNCPPISLIGKYQRASTRYNKLHSCTLGPFTVMDVNGHVRMKDKNGILNTISLNGASPVPITDHGTKRITPSHELPVRTTVSPNTDTGRNETPQYVVEK